MSVEGLGQEHLERTVATLEKEERSDGRGEQKVKQDASDEGNWSSLIG